MAAAKAELGQHLFHDKRISVDGRQSCATCQRQEQAFTDGRSRAAGTIGELHPRSSMSLVNIAYAPALTWAPIARLTGGAGTRPDAVRESRRTRAEGCGTFIPEGSEDGFDLSASAFRRIPGEDRGTLREVTKAIAAFGRSYLCGLLTIATARVAIGPPSLTRRNEVNCCFLQRARWLLSVSRRVELHFRPHR
jgi:cytochrome c peroxidase